MIKAELRFFLVDFIPFLNCSIKVGHVSVTIKKICDYLHVLNFFLSIKILFQKICFAQPSPAQHLCCQDT